MTKLNPIEYNGNRNLIHARDDIRVLVHAYNAAVKKINQLEDRVKKLEQVSQERDVAKRHIANEYYKTQRVDRFYNWKNEFENG